MKPGCRSRPDDPDPSQSPADSDAAAGRVAARIEADDGREECTLFPADAPAHELVTTWVTAADDAFVSLDDWR
ncbi:DUF7511 domain-containing protein [Halobacterium litoreum]|uniref:DUF7511 domain-containing protein n=1 Tax=Halobacterium litoreum TaxID=2039234 RepID=A0ABD5NEA1_9EURY|nr:hypothetical protein [Halobacterium litoreum]UHH13575.1 hypothetical protein LT972_00930 [Halobacterium litoreum]